MVLYFSVRLFVYMFYYNSRSFCKIRSLSGRVWEFPGDFPFTPTYWGIILSTYAIFAILVKDNVLQSSDITNILDKMVPFLSERGVIRALPWVALGAILGITSIMFGDEQPPWPTWVCLFSSWIVGAVSSYAFSFIVV